MAWRVNICGGPDASLIVPVSKVIPVLFIWKEFLGHSMGLQLLLAYVCFTLNHSTLQCSLRVGKMLFSFVYLPLPFFLVNNSCTLTSSCRVIYQETRSTETLFKYFCEVWQSLLFQWCITMVHSKTVFVSWEPNSWPCRYYRDERDPKWLMNCLIFSWSHFILNTGTDATKPAHFFVSPSGHSSRLSCVVLTHAESLSQ